jgi:L-serine/L-threonine ammonia-lyase
MAVKEYYAEQEVQQSPWVETPLRESYALSEAAGWYDHTFTFLHAPT